MKYRNVTISGLPGSGSSTLGRSLAQRLGWEYFSGGEFMRNYAIEKGLLKPELKIHHLATVYDDEFDRHVIYLLEIMRKKPRFVLGVADQVPPDGLERRVKRVTELVNEFGKY